VMEFAYFVTHSTDGSSSAVHGRMRGGGRQRDTQTKTIFLNRMFLSKVSKV
jgi:hypothetical protein